MKQDFFLFIILFFFSKENQEDLVSWKRKNKCDGGTGQGESWKMIVEESGEDVYVVVMWILNVAYISLMKS